MTPTAFRAAAQHVLDHARGHDRSEVQGAIVSLMVAYLVGLNDPAIVEGLEMLDMAMERGRR